MLSRRFSSSPLLASCVGHSYVASTLGFHASVILCWPQYQSQFKVNQSSVGHSSMSVNCVHYSSVLVKLCWSQFNVSQAVSTTVQDSQTVRVAVPSCVGHSTMLAQLCWSQSSVIC